MLHSEAGRKREVSRRHQAIIRFATRYSPALYTCRSDSRLLPPRCLARRLRMILGHDAPAALAHTIRPVSAGSLGGSRLIASTVIQVRTSSMRSISAAVGIIRGTVASVAA